MALPLERWAKQAVLLEKKGSVDPVADSRVLDDIDQLSQLHRQEWMFRSRMLAEGDDPTALQGVYAGLQALPPAGTLANVPSLNGEAAQWSTALWTPINPNAVQAPQAWRFATAFQVITVATPASLTINPRLGSFVAGASSVGGIQLGASSAIALTASITTNWFVRGDIWIRSIGIPGANSPAFGIFHVMAKAASAGNGVIDQNIIFGFTVASFDTSVASGFVLGLANTVTTINYSTLGIAWASWN